ncbi:MAG: ketopantoate reductase family protein, partial [Thermoplasmata archaeon]
MRILVFGAGALGSALGGILARKHDVILVGRKDNMDAVGLHGLLMTGVIESTADVRAYESVDGIEPPDIMILTTKAYDTKSAIDHLLNLQWDKTLALTLQNGLGNLELMRAWKGPKAFGGTTTMGAQLLSPGRVKVSGLGRTVIGADMDEAGARKMADAFSGVGLKVEVKRDIVAEIWAKAVVNSCINPVTAVLRVPNGRLLESETIIHLMSDICDECVAVAESAGVALPETDMMCRVRSVAEETAGN